MADKDVKYSIGLNDAFSGPLSKIEAKVTAFEKKINQLNAKLGAAGGGSGADRSSSIASGVLFGNAAFAILKKGFDMAKDFVVSSLHEYMEYQTSMLRIKNVSLSEGEGLKNQSFIMSEIDKFKIPMQEAISGYGEFLTMVRGAHITGDETRKLHDEILTISKVTGLATGQMDAAVRNLGKLLEEGKLESRHLRPLSYQLSGLMPYIAKEMGMSSGELSAKMSKNKGLASMNGGQGVDSTILMVAVEKFAKDLEKGLPEALRTVQSGANDLKNALSMSKIGLVEALNKSGELAAVMSGMGDWIRDVGTPLLQDMGVAFGNLLEALSALPWGDVLKYLLDFGSTLLDVTASLVDFIANFDFIGSTIKGTGELIRDLGDVVNLTIRKIESYIPGMGGSEKFDSYMNERATAASENAFTAALKKAGRPNYVAPLPDYNSQKLSNTLMGVSDDPGVNAGLVKLVSDKLLKQVAGSTWEQVKTVLSSHPELTKSMGTGYHPEYDAAIKKSAEYLQVLVKEDKDQSKSLHKLTGAGSPGSTSLTTDESKVTGSRPITINIDIHSMIENMFANATINGNNPEKDIDKIRAATLMAMTEVINVAQGYADSNIS